mmetsp:Transcript_25062/g.44528  ORF Transcript_25062/g.44528 Transcript_25062/m.44528 type:complete len:1019 (+) Transcript_25062:122-3178(+)
MAHLVDREVAGRVILQPAPGSESCKRVSYSFNNLASLVSEGHQPGLSSGVSSEGFGERGLGRRSPSFSLIDNSSSSRASPSGAAQRIRKGSDPVRSGSSFSPLLRPGMPNSRTVPPSNLAMEDIFLDEDSPKLVEFDANFRTFHLQAGSSQYSFCVDQYGSLEHLYYGNWVGSGHDLTYLSESDPSLTFETAPAGAQFTAGELKRMVEGEENIDSRQLWMLSTHMKSERGGDWHMARVENLTWRLRHLWEGKKEEAPVTASSILKVLERSSVSFREDSAADKADSGTARQSKRVIGARERNQLETESRPGRQGYKCSKLLEVSEFGTGDFRTPSLSVSFRKDGSRLLPLVYKKHQVISGIVPSTSGLPLLGARNRTGAQTLVVDMVDTYTELKVQLLYTLFPDISAVSRRVIVRNSSRLGMGDVDLVKCMSGTFDFLTNDWHLVSLHGGWACERNITTRRLQEGMVQLGSNRGVSSHQMNPFCVLTAGPPCEDHGLCYGFLLLYSGNWLMEVEQTQTGHVRVNVGLSDTHFSWDLGTQQSFESPECICVFSDKGLGGVTSTFHRLINERLIAPRWRDLICPVLINTWEALYFNVEHENIMKLARPAKDVGVELLVMDDGWFVDRNDDTTSLGDWIEDKKKLPRGLNGLAKDLNAMGLKLGIWMEPEMVNKSSVLYQEHPEWVLHHPARVRSEGRNQLVLDLTRSDVQDYIIQSVSNVLGGANIEYLKWDMNRALTDAYSAALPPSQQGEVYHRYVLGLYRIFEAVTLKFPHVLFESCASGGGRFDAALLAWCPQAWCSDNSDAYSRTRIQMGTSMWAPVRCMGAHIAACPSHQTHRTFMMKTRFIVALWGTFGLELDLNKLSREELDEVKELVALRKRLSQLTLHGSFFRLPGFGYPGAAHANSAGIGDSNVYAWMFVAPEQDRAVVSALIFHRDTVGRFPSRLKLRGLRPNLSYDITEHVPTPVAQGVFNGMFQAGGPTFKHQRRLQLSGLVLMEVGVPVHFNFDGDSLLLELTANS